MKPGDPCAYSCPGRFSSSSVALFTFNENSQVLPGNYSQETYCQARVRTQHKQSPAAMRWVIQLWIYISKSLSGVSRFCRNKVPVVLWLHGRARPVGRDGCVSQEGVWVLPSPGQGTARAGVARPTAHSPRCSGACPSPGAGRRRLLSRRRAGWPPGPAR